MNVLFEQRDSIGIISINRADKLNALNFDTLQELKAIVEKVNADESIRGVILTGVGDKAFVAGADIKEIANLDQHDGVQVARNGQDIFALIENAPKIYVAVVNGYALGGGCELAMACHLRIASDKAQFSQPEVNLGIIPGYGGTQRLTLLVGKAKALELICTADYIDAETALAIGLVNHVVNDDPMIKSEEILAKIIQKPKGAIALSIKAVNAAVAPVNGYEVEAEAFGACTKHGDFKEGTSAFLEKRKPKFD